MSASMTLTPMRKGVKSCIECRTRKVRCLWTQPGATSCDGCTKRRATCAPQLFKARVSVDRRVSSQDRLTSLEKRLDSIYAAVSTQQKDRLDANPSVRHDQIVTEQRPFPREQDADASSRGGPSPAHFNLLFDNGVLEMGESPRDHKSPHLKQPSCPERYVHQARRALSRLIPSRVEVETISKYAASWMSLYHSLLPSITTAWTGEGLLAQHALVRREGAHPITVAMFLLSLAITARQMPPEMSGPIQQWPTIDEWIIAVVSTVENTMIPHSSMVGTLEGIEMMTVYVRLQLGLGNMRTWWLALRQIIALAELLGLPRLAHRAPATDDAAERIQLDNGRELWRMICAIDRMAALMFNLPTATASHRLPKIDIVLPDGEVLAYAYLFQLSSIAPRIQEIDDAHAAGESCAEFYSKVVVVDQELRNLAAQAPQSWWDHYESRAPWAQLIQCWHNYALVRTHLHSAISKNEHDQLVYSRIICLTAGQNMALRYLRVRPQLPPGFFLCRIYDMQIFTAVIFLLLSCYGDDSKQSHKTVSAPDYEKIKRLISQTIGVMQTVAGQVGNDFVREAIPVIQSLVAHFEDGDGPQNWTLKVPLLGQIHIRRRRRAIPTAVNSATANLGMTRTDPVTMQPPPIMTEVIDTPPWLLELDMNVIQPDIMSMETWTDWNQLTNFDGAFETIS